MKRKGNNDMFRESDSDDEPEKKPRTPKGPAATKSFAILCAEELTKPVTKVAHPDAWSKLRLRPATKSGAAAPTPGAGSKKGTHSLWLAFKAKAKARRDAELSLLAAEQKKKRDREEEAERLKQEKERKIAEAKAAEEAEAAAELAKSLARREAARAARNAQKQEVDLEEQKNLMEEFESQINPYGGGFPSL